MARLASVLETCLQAGMRSIPRRPRGPLRLCLATAFLLAGCGSGASGGQSHLRENEKIEREARYAVTYSCGAEHKSAALGTIAVDRWLGRDGTGETAMARWEWSSALPGYKRRDGISLRGVWDPDKVRRSELGAGRLEIAWDLFPSVASRLPAINFRTIAGDALPFHSSPALGNIKPLNADSYWPWSKVRQAEADGRGLVAVVEAGPRKDWRQFQLRANLLARAETMIRALVERTAADARDYRARCTAVEQVPVVD